MPSELTIELKKALLEGEGIRKELLGNERQSEENRKGIEEARESISENREKIDSLMEDFANESKRFEKKATTLEVVGEDARGKLVNEVEKINENNELLRQAIVELEEKNEKLENKLIEITQKNEILPSSREEIEQKKEKNRAKVEFLVKMAEEAEKFQLETFKIEHDYFEEEGREYLLELSNDFKIFQLLFENFIQTELLNNQKKAEIFAELLINFINRMDFIGYMLEIYHSNRSILSLDTKSYWGWCFDMGDKECNYTQALASAISYRNTKAAIRLLCYGADPEVVELMQDGDGKKLNDILVSFDETNKTNFSGLIQASIDLKAGIQCLNNGSTIEAIAKIASAIKLYPTFVSQYIKTQFDFAMLQANNMVPTDETDYHFLLELIDLCAYICHMNKKDPGFKALIQDYILPQVTIYPLIDSEKALFKNKEEVKAFLERPYIKQIYTASSYITTINCMVEGEKSASTRSSLSFFNKSKTNSREEFEKSDQWESPSF